MPEPKNPVRIAAMADIHYTKHSQGLLRATFSAISDGADVFLMCGDLTDTGLPEEAQVLVNDLKSYVRIPIVAVLGNHDHESGKPTQVADILNAGGVELLDGTTCEFHGIGFAGAKGFAGGFDPHALQPWGEETIKHFVREAVEEALKLESALAKLHTASKVALLHYSPIRATVEGEQPEVYCFLGSSRLEESINRTAVAAVFHGHAHHGSPESATRTGVPVYNVSRPVLEKAFPDRHPFRTVQISPEATDHER